MMPRSVYIIVLLLLSFCAQAQSDEIVPKKPIAKPISNIIFQFDNRNENYYGEKAKMNGLKLGLESYKRVRVGVGFYTNPRFYPFLYPDRPSNVSETFSMKYTVFWTEVVPFRGFRYEISFPMAIGSGFAEVSKFKTTSDPREFLGTDTVTGLKVFDIGLNGHYKPIPFVGIGAGCGYRISRKEVPNFSEPLTDFYFDFKLKIFVGYIYKSIFKPKSIKEEKAYYEYRREQCKAKRKKKK